MRMMLSISTGRMYGSEEEYINQVIVPAFDRIRRYGKQSKRDGGESITNKDELLRYITKVTGSKNHKLSNWYSKSDDYDRLIAENKTERAEIRVQKETRLSYNKSRAKNEGLIFVGRDSRKRLYAYDYGNKKRISVKPYRGGK